MINALRAVVCVIIGALMASTTYCVSFDPPHPLHGLPYILAVALAINLPGGRTPGALALMAFGLVAASIIYVFLTWLGFYKELWFAGHTFFSVITLILCCGLVDWAGRSGRVATYTRFPPVGVTYGLLSVAALAMLPFSRMTVTTDPSFEIFRRLIVYATLAMFWPGLILAIILNFLKPSHVPKPGAAMRRGGKV